MIFALKLQSETILDMLLYTRANLFFPGSDAHTIIYTCSCWFPDLKPSLPFSMKERVRKASPMPHNPLFERWDDQIPLRGMKQRKS